MSDIIKYGAVSIDIDEIDDLGCLGDCFYEVFEFEPDEGEYAKIFRLLPEHIHKQMIMWGLSDTEVRESVCTYMQSNHEKFSHIEDINDIAF